MAIHRVETGLLEVPEISLIIISCLKLVHSPQGARGHIRRISRVAQGLGVVTGSLGIPLLIYTRLSHNARIGNGSRGPTLSSLHRSNSVRRSTSVIVFLCHRGCCSGRGKRSRSGNSPGGTRYVITGGHRNRVGAVPVRFSNRFAHFASISVCEW